MTGEMKAVEEAGVAFDPTDQHLDLSKEEKRRTTALVLAINAYRELIIKEGRSGGSLPSRARAAASLRYSALDGIVEAAWKFDLFIKGEHSVVGQGVEQEDQEEEGHAMTGTSSEEA
jgi:hypothetical protein